MAGANLSNCNGIHQAGSYLVVEESLASLHRLWADSAGLNWPCLFALPPWIDTWWRCLATAVQQPLLLSVRDNQGQLLGIAPLMVNQEIATFMGDPQVCDYFDFALRPGMETEFFSALLCHLQRVNLAALELAPLRADAAALEALPAVAAKLHLAAAIESLSDARTWELELPATWEQYLLSLTSKERHEARRKLRRLAQTGRFSLQVHSTPEAVAAAMDTFLELFGRNRKEKAMFMTMAMENFFRRLAVALGRFGLTRLYCLEIEGEPAAAALCFDYQDTVFLYNNGYDHRLSRLSPGLMSKLLSIEDSIRRGRKRYDFLKGDEPYKRRLGARPMELRRLRLQLH